MGEAEIRAKDQAAQYNRAHKSLRDSLHAFELLQPVGFPGLAAVR